MADEEKTAWVSAVSAAAGLLAYLVFVVAAVGNDAPVAASRVHVRGRHPRLDAARIRGGRSGGQEPVRDERDAEIARRGDQTRHHVLLLACAIVLSLALNKTENFWIAGALFAGVSLSFVIGTGVQISGHRHGVSAR